MVQLPELVLASHSPRRAALLEQMGFSFRILTGHVCEDSHVPDHPVDHVMTLSERKARAVLDRVNRGIIVGADTIVFLKNKIYGKPNNEEEARWMLKELSGETHHVFTGFTLLLCNGSHVSDVEKTAVTFRALENWEIDAYVRSGRSFDKAGGYGIQDQSGLFVERIDGCFYNVVGFPLTRFYKCLKNFWKQESLEKILRIPKAN